jgi:hypothetical protein
LCPCTGFIRFDKVLRSTSFAALFAKLVFRALRALISSKSFFDFSDDVDIGPKLVVDQGATLKYNGLPGPFCMLYCGFPNPPPGPPRTWKSAVQKKHPDRKNPAGVFGYCL